MSSDESYCTLSAESQVKFWIKQNPKSGKKVKNKNNLSHCNWISRLESYGKVGTAQFTT